MIDWVKMRTDLYRDPKVIRMAEHLENSPLLQSHVHAQTGEDMCVTRNVTRCATVGALVTVWGVTRHQGRRDGVDLLLDGASLSTLDTLADLPGIGEALQAVGWVVDTGHDSLIFPKFFEDNNIEPRSKAAERQKRYRDNKRDRNVTRNGEGNVTRNVTGDDRVEESKSREEKSEAKPLPSTASNAGIDPNQKPKKRRKTKHEYHEDFLTFYEAYPRHEGIAPAYKEWQKAGKGLVLDKGLTKPEAVAYLLQAAVDFAKSRAGQRGTMTPHPASWLSKMRYMDDRSDWDLGEVTEATPQGPGVTFDPNNTDPERGKL